MALYREGKAAMAADGTVTGTGTKWQSSLSLIRPGATIMFLSSPIQMAVVNKVVSDTEIKAITTKGAVVASSDYAILLSDSLTVDGLAQDVAETLRYYQSKETVIADAVEFFKTFDFEALQSLANQVRADSESADASATAAAASESAAKTSETNAKASENKAKTSETNAKASETAAKTSETNAKASETAAKTSETNAKASETAAKTSETNAKSSENKAKTSETNAKASETAAKTSETNAKASETAAKTSETNAKASETAANSAKTDAQTAKGQTQDLYNQTVGLVAGVQAPDELPPLSSGSRAWMKIANVKSAGYDHAFAQFIIGGGTVYGNANLPVDIFSISGRDLPDTLTSDNIDANFTQRVLIASRPNDNGRIKLGVVKNTDNSFDVYIHAPSGWIPELWLNRVNIQAGESYITGPIIDRTGYAWITTEPAGIVYNSPSDYLMANDSTIPRTNVANTFSQPQAISVPSGNATLTLNGCTVRANNNNVLVLSTPYGSEGIMLRPNGDNSTNGQTTISGNGDVLVNGTVKSNAVVSTNGDAFIARPVSDPSASNGQGRAAPGFRSCFNAAAGPGQAYWRFDEEVGYNHRISFYLDGYGSATQVWQMLNDGGIWNSSRGDVSWAGTSDLRYKDNVVDYDGLQSLANIKSMRMIKFTYKDDDRKRERRGVAAQQIMEIDPCYVKNSRGSYVNENGEKVVIEKLLLDTNPLLMDALCAIKALSAQVDELKEEIKNLKG